MCCRYTRCMRQDTLSVGLRDPWQSLLDACLHLVSDLIDPQPLSLHLDCGLTSATHYRIAEYAGDNLPVQCVLNVGKFQPKVLAAEFFPQMPGV